MIRPLRNLHRWCWTLLAILLPLLLALALASRTPPADDRLPAAVERAMQSPATHDEAAIDTATEPAEPTAALEDAP